MNKIINIFKFLVIVSVCFIQTSGIYSNIENPNGSEQIKELPITPDIEELRERINLIFDEYEAYEYDISLKIISLDHPQTIFEYQSDKPFTPASNLKILTSGIAFMELGGDFRWATDFYLNNFGNLYIRASGDPTWNDSFRPGMINRVTKSIADSLRNYGYGTINNIIIDPGTFQNYPIGFGWKDENRLFSYSSKPSIIAFNDNAVQIRIDPTTVGRVARISLYPINSGFEIINNVTTNQNRNRQGFDFSADPQNNILTVSGNIWVNSRTQYRSIATPRPELYALDILSGKLREHGINIRGAVYYDSLSGSDIILNYYSHYFSIYSPPLSEIAEEINKKSNNFVANQLFLTVAEESWESIEPQRIIRQWLLSNNVATENLLMFDGSGLSIYNQCSTDILVSVLKIMSKSKWVNDFQNTMAISGIDGTLKNAFKEDILHGRVYAKTGFILGARALSGYTTTADDEKLAFSFIINKTDSRISNFNRIIEKILVEIAEFSREEVRIRRDAFMLSDS